MKQVTIQVDGKEVKCHAVKDGTCMIYVPVSYKSETRVKKSPKLQKAIEVFKEKYVHKSTPVVLKDSNLSTKKTLSILVNLFNWHIINESQFIKNLGTR